jgi:hypothetical protein
MDLAQRVVRISQPPGRHDSGFIHALAAPVARALEAGT